MKIENYQMPKSAFLSVEKDLSLIVDMIFKNERLKKLLYYDSKDCLKRPNLTEEQTQELIGKNIRIVPKLEIDNTVETYLIISLDDFVRSYNEEFRDNIIEFDIICHFDQWNLGDFSLRPYKIAAELDSMFNERYLTGIGKLEFLGAKQMLLTDEYAGVCLMYKTYHGTEDEKGALTKKENNDIINNFNDIFNK